MKVQSFFDPDSAESFALVLFLWRLKKAAPLTIAASAIALSALWANTVGLVSENTVSDTRLAATIEAQPKSVSYRHAGPFRVRVDPPPTYRHAGPFRVPTS